MNSGTYLSDPRYLELNEKCRFVHRLPSADPNHFAQGYDEVVGMGFLTPQEYKERETICLDWFAKEVERLLANGYTDQAEHLQGRLEGRR